MLILGTSELGSYVPDMMVNPDLGYYTPSKMANLEPCTPDGMANLGPQTPITVQQPLLSTPNNYTHWCTQGPSCTPPRDHGK